MPFVKRQRTYYKDGAVVPESSITDFGKTKYYKNIVTTKYWKEITTEVEGDVLAYAAYYKSGDSLSSMRCYAKTPLGENTNVYFGESSAGTGWASSIDDLAVSTYYSPYKSLTETNMVVLSYTLTRQYDQDIYVKGMIPTTTVVEGTPEDYTYTTEEITTVEVTANDDYDYTEFVPSAEFDYYVDKNKLYQLATVKDGRLVSYDILNPNNYCKFTINPTPADATVIINGKNVNTVRLIKNSQIVWSVSAEGYAKQSGELRLNEDTDMDVVLQDCVYVTDQVIFESSTAGTYEIELLENGNYEVYCIGGGSGGYWQGNSKKRLSGASGGGFIGIVKISKGIYNVTVGAGSGYKSDSYTTTANGGNSSIDNIVIAGGGGGCGVTSASSYTLAKAGNAPILSAIVIQETLNTAGNAGKYSSSGSYHVVIAGGASVYNGYGKGGNGGSTPGYGGDGGGIESGTAGYVKIVWKG